jgi:2'-5' RNA ligase
MTTIQNAYISIDLDRSALQPIFENLQRTLAELRIPAEISASSSHVSLAYVQGTCEKCHIENIARDLASEKLSAQVVGVEVFEGMTTDFDYVALTLARDNDFEQASEVLSGHFDVKQFAGGFRTHVTLFQIRKGVLSADESAWLNSYLRGSVHSDCQNTTVSARSISVFNTNRQCEMALPVAC